MDTAHTRPRTLNLPERIELARALKRHGLEHVRLPGLTTDTPPCLGNQFGCPHDCCTSKPTTAVGGAPQPWQARAPRQRAA